MMFCDNPKCKFHEEVSENITHYTKMINLRQINDTTTQYETQTSARHEIYKPGRGRNYFYFCDDCSKLSMDKILNIIQS